MSLVQFALGLGNLLGDLAEPLRSAPSAPTKSALDKTKRQVDKVVDRDAARAQEGGGGDAGPIAVDVAVSSAQLVQLAAEPAMAWDAGGWTCVAETDVRVSLSDGTELARTYAEGTRIPLESGFVLFPAR